MPFGMHAVNSRPQLGFMFRPDVGEDAPSNADGAPKLLRHRLRAQSSDPETVRHARDRPPACHVPLRAGAPDGR